MWPCGRSAILKEEIWRFQKQPTEGNLRPQESVGRERNVVWVVWVNSCHQFFMSSPLHQNRRRRREGKEAIGWEGREGHVTTPSSPVTHTTTTSLDILYHTDYRRKCLRNPSSPLSTDPAWSAWEPWPLRAKSRVRTYSTHKWSETILSFAITRPHWNHRSSTMQARWNFSTSPKALDSSHPTTDLEIASSTRLPSSPTDSEV